MIVIYLAQRGFPGRSDGKEFSCNPGDLGSILGAGRSPGEGNGYPLQYSCLEDSIDRGAWWVIVHGITKSQTQLSDFTFLLTLTSIESVLPSNHLILCQPPSPFPLNLFQSQLFSSGGQSIGASASASALPMNILA